MKVGRSLRRPTSPPIIFLTCVLALGLFSIFIVSSPIQKEVHVHGATPRQVNVTKPVIKEAPQTEEKHPKPEAEAETEAEVTGIHLKAMAKSLTSPLYDRPFPKVPADVEKQEAIKEAFLHAWNNYAEKCFGSDELRPVSGTCGNSLHGGLTIIDSISTIILMNLTEEYAKCRDFVMNDFRPRGAWSLFEFIIRYLGGLLSAADLSGDEVFIDAAKKVGYAILPILEKTKGFYSSRFSFSTNENKEMEAMGGGGGWNLAEVGTFQVEFLTLARLTGDERFITAALNVYKTLWKKRGGLISSGIGGGEDSYYEYIIKCYLLTGGSQDPFLEKYLAIARDIKEKLKFNTSRMHLIGLGPAGRTAAEPLMEHLATFAGGMFAIGAVKKNPAAIEDLALADELARTYATVYKGFKSGVMAENVRYNQRGGPGPEFRVTHDEYFLRPESVESVYLMWKFTGLQKYRDWAWDMFKGINKSCRVPGGFSSIRGVDSDNPVPTDSMESFFLAETLKYLYLTFSDSELLSPTEWVFNTEAHPVKIWDKDIIEKFRNSFSFVEEKT